MTARFSWNQGNTRGHRPRLQQMHHYLDTLLFQEGSRLTKRCVKSRCHFPGSQTLRQEVECIYPYPGRLCGFVFRAGCFDRNGMVCGAETGNREIDGLSLSRCGVCVDLRIQDAI